MKKKLSEKELAEIRANSDMGDPDPWGRHFKIICDGCLNKLGGSCDVYEMGDMSREDFFKAEDSGSCEWFIPKQN